jgi:hypothetical protein
MAGKEGAMDPNERFEFLEWRPDASIRQPFVKGRNIWAEVFYRETIGEDARTPEQLADDFELPIGAILESIAWCERNQDHLKEEHRREVLRWLEFEKRCPSLKPPEATTAP